VTAGLRTAPMALEAAFQAAGIHWMMTAHKSGLPQAVGQVVVLRQPPEDKPVSIAVQQVGERWHVDVDGLDGPILRLRDYAMVERGDLPPGDRFDEPEGGRPVCFPVSGPSLAEATAGEPVAAWLSTAEIDELAGRGTPRRVSDRLTGRIAAKRALGALTGAPPDAIRIRNLPSGAPVADIPGFPGVAVSISHRDGEAVAAAATHGRIGIDLEVVERRDASFGATWFDASERALAATPLEETAIWAIKEAVLKALGTGLAMPPAQVRVVALRDGAADVELGPEAEKHRAGAPLSVTWWRRGADRLVASARLA
jgi:4'-phosphopantetheinyl transferase